MGRLALPVIADESLQFVGAHFNSSLAFYWAQIETLGATPMNPHTCDRCAELFAEHGC
jgi:hypothetical protein